eukprot:14874037-Heterocapsa_arctica.AAC.1
MIKGRSASVQLNGHCRRACSLELAGDLGILDFWMPSAKNPADKPSRVHGGSKPTVAQPPPYADVIPTVPQAWA